MSMHIYQAQVASQPATVDSGTGWVSSSDASDATIQIEGRRFILNGDDSTPARSLMGKSSRLTGCRVTIGSRHAERGRPQAWTAP
jgi:hypothetical protein